MLGRARCSLGSFTVLAHCSRAAARRVTRNKHPQPSLPVGLPELRLGARDARRFFTTLTPALFQKNLSNEQPAGSEAAPKGRKSPPIDPRTQEPRQGSNWNYTMELYALAQRLGHDPKEVPSLTVALTHRSARSTEQPVEAEEEASPGEFRHNGRLAVLGQHALRHYVYESLYYKYPNMEGNLLLDLGSHVTGTECLAKVADYAGILDLIQTRYKLNNPSKAYVIARAFCAVIAAVYTDVGPQAARKVIHDFVLPQLAGQDLHELIKLQHPKFMLKSILRGQGQRPPSSRLLRESGRLTHFPSFVVGVYSGESLLAEGCGTSLKRAEKEAVLAALHNRFQTEVASSPLPSDNEDFCEERNVDLFVEERKDEDSNQEDIGK